jgi:hypothetical protein
MPAAVAWWNMLQEQFTQAVANAMTPSAAAPAPEGAGAPKANAPKEAPKAGPAAPAAPLAATGKPRTSRAKTDKT